MALTKDEWNSILGDEIRTIKLTTGYKKEYEVKAKVKVWEDVSSFGVNIVDEIKKNNFFVYEAMFENKSDAIEVYKQFNDENIRVYFASLQNVERVLTFCDPYKDLFRFLEIVLLVACVVFVFYMSYSSVKRNTYNIGVLKAFGMSIKDLYGVYFINLAMQLIFCIIFDTIFLNLFTVLANKFLITGITNIYGSAMSSLAFNIFSLTPLTYLYNILMVVVILLAGMIIPILKIKNIKPIDIIRNKY